MLEPWTLAYFGKMAAMFSEGQILVTNAEMQWIYGHGYQCNECLFYSASHGKMFWLTSTKLILVHMDDMFKCGQALDSLYMYR